MSALDEVRDLAEAVTQRRSLRLWDVQLGGRPGRTVVRVFVDSDPGVDLDTVAAVSEEISRGLDLRDPIPGSYTLEVSSPGLERALRAPHHFALSVGKKVAVKTREQIVPNSHLVEGEIVAATDDSVSMRTNEGTELVVQYEEIKSARTIFEWK